MNHGEIAAPVDREPFPDPNRYAPVERQPVLAEVVKIMGPHDRCAGRSPGLNEVKAHHQKLAPQRVDHLVVDRLLEIAVIPPTQPIKNAQPLARCLGIRKDVEFNRRGGTDRVIYVAVR